MKNIISICLVWLISTTSFAQKCKENVDPITNEKKYEFVYTATGPSSYGNLTYEVKNGKATLTKEIYYTGAINMLAPVGSEVFFKLENGDVVKLKTVKETAGKMYVVYGVVTGYNFVMELSKEDLNKLATSPVVLMRVPKLTEDGYYDLDKSNLSVKKSKKPLMKGAACISGYLQ